MGTVAIHLDIIGIRIQSFLIQSLLGQQFPAITCTKGIQFTITVIVVTADGNRHQVTVHDSLFERELDYHKQTDMCSDALQ